MAVPDKCAGVWAQFLEFQKSLDVRFQEIIDVYEARARNKKRKPRKRRNVATKAAPAASNTAKDDKPSNTEATKCGVALTPILEESSCSPVLRTSQRSAAKRATELTSIQLKLTLNEKLRNPKASKKGNSFNTSLLSVASTSKVSEASVNQVEKLNLPECKVVLSRCSDDMITDALSSNDKTETSNVDISVPIFTDSFKVPMVPPIRPSRATRNTSSKKNTSIPVITDIADENPKPEGNLNGENCDHSSNQVEGIDSVCTDEKSLGDRHLLPPAGCENKLPLPNETADVSTAEGDPSEAAPALRPSDISKENSGVSKDNTSLATTRPVRIRTKNRKYNEEDFFSDPLICKPNASSTIKNDQPIPSLSGNVAMVSADHKSSKASQNGKKRKSESDDSGRSTKMVKTAEDVEQPLEEKSGGSTDEGKTEASPSRSPESFSRTKTPAKTAVNNIVIEMEQQETEADCVQFPLETPVPQHRMTRTRTRELNNRAKLIKTPIGTKGKENKNASLLKILHSSDKKNKGTPLATNNFIFSPPKTVHSSQKYESGKKLETSSARGIHKEEAARLKKQELMKAQSEVAKRKREEKEQRRVAHKQAMEKKETERLAKIQRDKEERERMIAQSKKIKEEQILKKKQMTEAMLREAEERRLKEEEAKKARIKKQEEENKRLAEERMRQAEEARKLHEMRLAQEAKEKEISLKEAEKKKKMKLKENLATTNNYVLTPSKDEIPPKKPKDENNYGLSDAGSDDSTDDEKRPKKVIPKWATKSARKKMLMYQSLIHPNLISAFFPLHVNIKSLENANVRCRQRASSAVWDTSIVLSDD